MEKLGEISFAVGEISGLVVLGERNVIGFANVVGLESGDRVFLGEFFEGGVIGTFWVEGFELFVEGVGSKAEGLTFAVASKKDEKERTNDWEANNDESPE